jgi:peptidyl-dipeptidase Dcp
MMVNPLLVPSGLPFGAPVFDEVRREHYMPAFKRAIGALRAEVDAIVGCSDAPSFANTVEALEFSGRLLDGVSSVFFNLLEADTDDAMQAIAEEVSPLLTEISMYISLNDKLFARVKEVYDCRGSLSLERDQERLLEKTYKGFVRGGALLSAEDKATYAKLSEELSLLQLKFGKNVLAATHAFFLHLEEESELEGLPDYVREAGAETDRARGLGGWVFDLTAPSYVPFLKFSARRDLRERLWRAYNTRATAGENDNTDVCRQIVDLRLRMARLLGYDTYADYATEDRMVKTTARVYSFLDELMGPSLPAARREVAELEAFAQSNGFDAERLEPWDFAYWSEKLRASSFDLREEELKPYFRLEDCIAAVFGLAGTLYGLSFVERSDLPVYHPDVRVYDVQDSDGRHLALFYADFFPRPSKRSGAWMTEFRGQRIVDGVEERPFISIVTNFSKPTSDAPSLLTHDELTTFLHEFGHSLHGILSEGRYGSLTCTNVDHDFVELPSQIMENWGFEREWLRTFAKHYKTGEPLPDELVDRIVRARNFHAAYAQVRQLQFGILDMAWHTLAELPDCDTVTFEDRVLEPYRTLPQPAGACTSTSFSHIFSGGYCAGYYSYKWAEVLEADAFSLFQEKGIFNREVARSFRECILSRGSSEDEAVLYRNFRGHDPQPSALLAKLGIVPCTENNT